MLQLEKVSAVFEKNIVIKELSYKFEDNKITAITGASGIGKTTLLNIIAGLKKPTKGKVVSDYKQPAYIFQEPRLFPWLTSLENITAVCKDTEKAKNLLHTLIDDSEIESKYPDELSGGMKQRVSIARALAYESDIVFMDEPFKGLDNEMKNAVRSFVFEYLKGKTIVIVTHDTEDLDFCDCVLQMKSSPVTELVAEESGKSKTE